MNIELWLQKPPFDDNNEKSRGWKRLKKMEIENIMETFLFTFFTNWFFPIFQLLLYILSKLFVSIKTNIRYRNSNVVKGFEELSFFTLGLKIFFSFGIFWYLIFIIKYFLFFSWKCFKIYLDIPIKYKFCKKKYLTLSNRTFSKSKIFSSLICSSYTILF